MFIEKSWYDVVRPHPGSYSLSKLRFYKYTSSPRSKEIIGINIFSPSGIRFLEENNSVILCYFIWWANSLCKYSFL